jgi:hypothetical protein
VFLPFHYGYFDVSPDLGPGDHPRAANELTRTEWDPVSKQPIFKVTAVSVSKVADATEPAAAPTTAAAAPANGAVVRETVGGPAAEARSTRVEVGQ